MEPGLAGKASTRHALSWLGSRADTAAELLRTAQAWQARLDPGEAENRAAIARRKTGRSGTKRNERQLAGYSFYAIEKWDVGQVPSQPRVERSREP